ncbi:restriction endonuclease subunit S [Candidatus Corynebacterium faecigallinarum]|uniref:restriction endonuclease subunit S n=1 Tax=Candidatus Corynebacterium faecigallinarum TaxID=2838528 RepID=UPI003FD21A21
MLVQPYNLDLPSGWDTAALRYLANVETGSGDTQDADPDGQYPFIVRSPSPMASAEFSYDTEAVLTAGDGNVGEIFHHIKGKFHAHQRVYVISGFKRVTPRYFYYFFSSHFRHMAKGGEARTTVDSVRRWMITDMPFAVPPIEVQNSISDYLDRETQKIDELITEQRGLIETLRERRRAVIDAKSLGGMDPLDPQKNLSWSSSALGYGFEVKLGKMLDSGKVRDDMARNLPYIRAGNIQDSGLDIGNLNSMPFTREEELKFNLECNDLLVVEGGAIGTSVVLEEDLAGVCFQKTVNRLRGTKDWNPRYYRYVLLAYRERGILDILANKSTIAHFTAEKLRGLRVPVPSIREQNEIAADLDHATSRIDGLIAESEDLIALSEERRAALITAAVTGQIDVRTTA